MLCIVHQRASDFFGGAAALSSSRRHTPRELEGLRGADSFETVTYVTLSDGGAGATGSWVPWWFVSTAVRRVVGFQKNTAHPEMTHHLASAKTLKSRIWRRAALSSVAHAPTTITTDFAWCGMLAVLPWWPRTVTFGKVEIKGKKLERTGPNFLRSTSFQILRSIWQLFGGTPAYRFQFVGNLEKLEIFLSFRTALTHQSAGSARAIEIVEPSIGPAHPESDLQKRGRPEAAKPNVLGKTACRAKRVRRGGWQHHDQNNHQRRSLNYQSHMYTSSRYEARHYNTFPPYSNRKELSLPSLSDR